MHARPRRAVTGLCALLVSTVSASAQDAPAPAWAWTSGRGTLEGAIETYSAYYSMSGTWWNLAASSAPDFDTDRSFAELWVHPKLDGTFKSGDHAEIYAALSIGATQTIGGDAFDYEDGGSVRFGSAVLCADLRILPQVEPRPDHASYVASRLEVLSDDRRAIFQAAAHAQRAVTYLHGLQPATEGTGQLEAA